MVQKNASPIQGLFLLVDRKSDEGLMRWTDELLRRKIPALVLADGHTVTHNPSLIQSIADQQFDVGCKPKQCLKQRGGATHDKSNKEPPKKAESDVEKTGNGE